MKLLARLSRMAKTRRDRRKRPEVTDFSVAAARLGPDDVAIDCGANVGIYTRLMAAGGATVYAFEPNPAAYACLAEACRDLPNVRLIQAAVTAKPGQVKLYFHKHADEDPIYWSTGSSLLAGKRNVRDDRYALVDAVVLSRFIAERNIGRIKLMKMDIEGAEVEVINDLLDHDLHQHIDAAFVEVHERRVPELRAPTEALRARLGKLGAAHFRLDWR